jgi:ABC-type proline/glycine betaine transport system substrate-binding protein
MLTKTVDKIINVYDILYNKIFILNNEKDKSELMCTYNIESSQNIQTLPDTISLHRKKQTNTLYTINALNECIKTVNNGILDTSFQLNWENYRNSILVTNDDGLRRIDTSIKEVIHIKIKK